MLNNEESKRNGKNETSDRKTIILSAAMLALSAVLLFGLGKQLWDLKDIPKVREIHRSALAETTSEPDELPVVSATRPPQELEEEPEYEDVKTFGLEPGQTVPPANGAK